MGSKGGVVTDFLNPSDLKGKIAEILVEQLFKSCNIPVFRFGYEWKLPHLLTQLKNSFAKERLRSMPDFIIKDKFGHPFFIEVKFKEDGIINEEKLECIRKHWPHTYIILIYLPSGSMEFAAGILTFPFRNTPTSLEQKLHWGFNDLALSKFKDALKIFSCFNKTL